jgi:hypothetical protein
MITAMTYLMLLLFFLAVGVISAQAIRLMRHDGRGPQRPPVSHFEDPRFRPPGASA